MLETNKHPGSVLQHFLGGRGVTTDEKGVFIQIQNTIVSSKALVFVNCLNTFVHDCRSESNAQCGLLIRFFPNSRSRRQDYMDLL